MALTTSREAVVVSGHLKMVRIANYSLQHLGRFRLRSDLKRADESAPTFSQSSKIRSKVLHSGARPRKAGAYRITFTANVTKRPADLERALSAVLKRLRHLQV